MGISLSMLVRTTVAVERALLLVLGLLLHGRPSVYIAAIKNAARISGPLILQYPLYGGIMDIITTTGLAAMLSTIFIHAPDLHPFAAHSRSCESVTIVPLPRQAGPD